MKYPSILPLSAVATENIDFVLAVRSKNATRGAVKHTRHAGIATFSIIWMTLMNPTS